MNNSTTNNMIPNRNSSNVSQFPLPKYRKYNKKLRIAAAPKR
jgi:hypothetical protein